jgi:hypothetical protein
LSATADDLPFDNGSVDLILSNFLLYAWILDEDLLENIYREFHRVLADGGEVRIYPAPDVNLERIRSRSLRGVMKQFDISQRFFTSYLNPGKYPPAYVVTMRKKARNGNLRGKTGGRQQRRIVEYDE